MSRAARRGRIEKLSATVFNIPGPDQLPVLLGRIARLWAEVYLADPALALELARKLPETEIARA